HRPISPGLCLQGCRRHLSAALRRLQGAAQRSCRLDCPGPGALDLVLAGRRPHPGRLHLPLLDGGGAPPGAQPGLTMRAAPPRAALVPILERTFPIFLIAAGDWGLWRTTGSEPTE